MSEVMPAKEKEPHFISPRLLDALGGVMEAPEGNPDMKQLVDKGAYVWGVEDREKGAGLFNHILLVSRVAMALAQELRKKDPERYAHLDMRTVFEVALLHDVSKLYAQDREFLSASEKESAGISAGFTETDPRVEEVGSTWLRQLGFSETVCENIKDHFPLRSKDDPYWKIGLVADYLTGQHVMTLSERLNDVQTRWIDERVKRGEKPRIDPEMFAGARATIEAVAEELFSTLGESDASFIESQKLNDPNRMTRSERFLRQTYEKKREERAKRFVRRVIGSQ